MTAVINTPTGASLAEQVRWNSIQWDKAKQSVYRLQMRIAKATREQRYGKAKALQHLLTRSFYAKVIAIKRVTENKGAKTPGVDGVIWKTIKEKEQAVKSLKRKGYQPLPLRRIYTRSD